MVKHGKWIWITALMVIVCLMTGNAFAGVMENVAGALWPESEAESWTLTLGMDVEVWPPFGERRLELANQLLKHLTLEIRKDKEGNALLQAITDGNRTAACTALTLVTAEAENDGIMTEEKAAEVIHDIFRLLEDGASFLKSLPDKVPESCSEKKIKQKLKTGMATRSVTVMLQSPEEGEHPLAALIRNAGETAVREKLKGWVFKGNQRFTLLFGEDGGLLKATISGRAGETEETLRNIRLEWRLKRTEGETLDEVTLKTPLADGSGRDNWILTRTRQEAETGGEDAGKEPSETLRFSFEYDQKHGNEKAQYRWDGELSGKDSDGVIGTVSWIQKKKNETKTLSLRTDMNVCSEKQLTGALEIIRISDKIEQEHVTLHIDWMKGAANESGNGQALLDPEAFQNELIRCLLTNVPEEDLGFIREDIPGESWQQILDAAKGS